MASSPLPNLHKNKKKHESRGSINNNSSPPPRSPSTFELEELAQNLSPLVNHHPSPSFQPPSALWQRWSPYLRSPVSFASPSFGSFFHSYIPSCKPPKLPRPSLLSRVRRRRRRVTGTLFGRRKGRVTFAVQVEAEDNPSLLLELSFPTNFLIDAMAAGAVTILLECEKTHGAANGTRKMVALWEEPVWTMYSNGLQCGLALSRPFGDEDHQLFHTIGAISTGAGVLPPSSLASKDLNPDFAGDGDHVSASDVMFIRTKFERVVGNNSEAFYMKSPGSRRRDGSGLSIFLLRI